jgi:hypothetical protein
MVSSLLLRLAGCSALFLLTQCKRDTPQPATPTLPAATQDGLNTIGFRVNGAVWLPKGSFNFLPYKAYYKNRTLWFNASQLVDGRLTTFGIYIKPTTTGSTTYDLATRTSSVGATYTETSPDDSYEVQRVGAGTLRITRLDSVQRIVAGTFEAELVSSTSGKTVRLTDGRFDLQY